MTLTTRHCIVETINRRHNALMPSVQVNDIAIYYELHGAGEPLVLINGLAADVSEYGDMIRWLAKRFTVLAFDNRGAGRTDKPHTPYSIEQMAADTAGLMQALGMKQAHVLGISMGGRIALALTLWHPGLVNRLVLVSTSAQGVRRGRRLRLLGVVSWLPQWQQLKRQMGWRKGGRPGVVGRCRAAGGVWRPGNPPASSAPGG
jgi:pimeloyl-ACP methyl ester carboxylesterase